MNECKSEKNISSPSLKQSEIKNEIHILAVQNQPGFGNTEKVRCAISDLDLKITILIFKITSVR